MNRRPRIVLYGGTFDPVHSGHLEIARKVRKLFDTDEVIFVPAQLAPHKVARDVTSGIHRYAMLALATQNDSRLIISQYEIAGATRGYTVDTLKHFRSKFGSAAELFFLMGADSWSEITTWRDWETLMTLTSHIVVTRPGYELTVTHISESLAPRVVDLRAYTPAEIPQILDESGPKIFVTDAAMVNVSATQVRRAARSGDFKTLRTLVPLPVADYIRKYELYQNSNEA